MALPSYATPVQRTYYYAYLFFCGVVFFFLIAPLIAIIPISFSVSPFMVFTDEMLTWPPDPDAWSLRWYKNMIGNCSADVVSSTVPCAQLQTFVPRQQSTIPDPGIRGRMKTYGVYR